MTRTSAVAIIAVVCTAGLVGTGSAWGAAAPAPAPDPTLTEVVVKVDLADGHTIAEVGRLLPIDVRSAVLASRGIYLIRSADPKYRNDPKKTREFADRVRDTHAVVYAEPNYLAAIDDTHYHAWPDGDPDDAGTDPAVWADQPAATELGLADAHEHSTGAGTVVAVLDTGVDPGHAALAGRLVPGWDYVDDDADPTEPSKPAEPTADQADAFGHGTFVSGVVALVAPDARIMPLRVLDSAGHGNVFVIAQAIMDAANAHVDVINISFGTSVKQQSNLLDEAIKYAQRRGVVVVAAAGNDHDDNLHFPAAQGGVLSVSALATDSDKLAAFADWGGWVDVAAPGEGVAGPVPGGRYAWWSGTSVSTPFVSGQAALLRSRIPGMPANKVTEAVNNTATRLDPRRKLGHGSVEFLNSLVYAQAHPR